MTKVSVSNRIGNMRQWLKAAAFKTPLGTYVFYEIRRLREKLALARYSDLEYITRTYRERFGREINLKDPQTYTEKLQWLKLFYRDADMPVCSDKFEVREYLTTRGYGYLLNELIGVYEDAEEIDFESLPKKFVAKASHGSSWNLICTDKGAIQWRTWKRTMNAWLKLNLYVFGREWNYKEQHPRIVIEKFLEQDPLIDYKFMCFNGEPRFIQINNDMDGEHYVDFYDLDWNRQQMTYETYRMSDHVLEKPPLLQEMICLARELSAPFPFVRVDFYNIEHEIIFGEITFFPGGGLKPLVSTGRDYDALVGAFLRLPDPNHNLDILAKVRAGEDLGRSLEASRQSLQ